MNKVERFITGASFPVRFLICIFGLAFMGFLLGLADAIAELLRVEWAKVPAVLAYSATTGVNVWAYFKRGRSPLSALGAIICAGLGIYALMLWP